MKRKFVIACGGTGGHLAPGIALAEKLTGTGHSCHLFISKKQVDTRLINKYKNLDYVPVNGVGLSLHPVRFVKFLVTLFQSLVYTFNWLKHCKPDVVIAFGGFISVSVVIAAFFLRIPIVLHEANRVPGRTIKMMRKLAKRIYLPDGLQMRGVRSTRIKYLGYPVRAEIQKRDPEEARRALGLEPKGKLLVLIGGSQGASAFNQWVIDHFKQLAEAGIHVYCITGLGDGNEGVLEGTSKAGDKVRATFKSFTDQVSDVLSAADLVITRAGAGSISEIIRCRVPSILIPYPHAMDDHQLVNALFFERQGGGVLLRQGEMGSLVKEVKELLCNEWLLERFRQNLAKLDEIDSAELIQQDLLELCSDDLENEMLVTGTVA